VAEQERINPILVRLARDLDLPIVCDNDAHFLRAEDHDAHDTLCCISMQKTRDDPGRLHYSRELYVKSPEQMDDLFRDLPEAVRNTAKIADRCTVELDFGKSHAPVVKIASDWGDLPVDAAGALERVRGFQPGASFGSSDWYKAFCSRFRLEPYDAGTGGGSAAALERPGSTSCRTQAPRTLDERITARLRAASRRPPPPSPAPERRAAPARIRLKSRCRYDESV